MTHIFDLDLPELDPMSSSWATNAYSTLAELRKQSWIVKAPMGYTILTHEDHRAFISDRRCRTPGIAMLEGQGVSEGVLHRFFDGLLVSLDGEPHDRLRRLVSRAFTPRAIEWLRPTMRDVFAGLLDPVLDEGRVDVVELVSAYPIPVICTLFGAPSSDWPLFSRTAPSVLKLFNPNLVENLPEIEAALSEIHDYLDQLITQKRASNDDDLFSVLIAAEEDGDRLSHAELVMLAGAILLGGTDTTRMHLVNAMAMFCRHPEQWKTLAEQPDLAMAAVDEVLRYAPSISDNFRVPKEDIEYKGIVIPAGTPLMLSVMAANRDPEVFEDPNRFDITRSSALHFTFGGGMHYCLGASLARMEMAEALTMLAGAIDEPSADGDVTWPDGFSNTWTPDSLPMRFQRK